MNPETNLWIELIKAGAGGLVLIAIVLFLRYMRDERAKSDVIFTTAMKFIADQREAHLKAAERIAVETSATEKSMTETNAAAYATMASAMSGLANEIQKLNESHAVHDAKMETALLSMRDVKTDRRIGEGRRKTNGKDHNAKTKTGI